MALRGIATSAIDISDGLAGDLGHILKASGVGARIDAEATMKLIAARAYVHWSKALFDTQKQLEIVLSGGDDYELAFTAPPGARQAIRAASASCQTPVARIGVIQAQPGLRIIDGRGEAIKARFTSFDHFAG